MNKREKGSMSIRRFLILMDDPNPDDVDRQVEAMVFLHAFGAFFELNVRAGVQNYTGGYRVDAQSFAEPSVKLARALNKIEAAQSSDDEDGTENED